MIEKMKKLTLLLYHRDKEEFLEKLRELGVVHVEEDPEAQSDQLASVRAEKQTLQRVITELKRAKAQAKETPASRDDQDVEWVAERFDTLASQKDAAAQKVASLRKDIALLEPWGDFEPEMLTGLADAGVRARFYECSVKQFDRLALGELYYAEVAREKGIVRFVVLERNGAVALEADEVALPSRSLPELRRMLKEAEAEEGTAAKGVVDLVAYLGVLEREMARLSGIEHYESVRESMAAAAGGSVLAMHGWMPEESEAKVRALLDSHSTWYEIGEPELEDNAPVKLENGSFAELYEPITRMFALPDYHELDPTPFFAPFFMFFYGMCLGDVGYGALVLVAAVVAMRKGPAKLHNIFKLGAWLGGMTIFNGFLLNSLFGEPVFNTEGVEGLFGAGFGIPLLGSVVRDNQTVYPALTFSILIGVTQMMLGMVLNAINKFRTHGLLYGIQPLAYVPLTLAFLIWLAKADFLGLGAYSFGVVEIGPFLTSLSSSVLIGLLLLGLVPLVFFNTPSLKLYWRPLRFLWEAYGYLSGVVGDGLSYLRLFALGLAGSLLGHAFNTIAFMLITNEQGAVNWLSPLALFTVVILVVGHGLNFALAALGAYVHSVRLIFVEFYRNLGFQGGGKPYKAFAKDGVTRLRNAN